jgi:hypothetical protein
MNFWLIFFGAQVAVMIFGMVKGSKKSDRFDGAKLEYRS